MKKLYKFLRTDLKSEHGDCTWKIDEWKHEENISLCRRGFHASKQARQALSYVGGEILGIVEVKGDSLIEKDKEVWSDMRVVKAYHWTKKDSVEFSIFAAELVIDIYEKKYPGDDRPRKAIESAKDYIKALKGGDKKEIAAYASYAAANAAYAAANASYAAAYASYAAAYAAYAAAYAAYAAAYAAYAAYAAAYAAYAAATLMKKLDNWMTKRIKKLELYDDK